MAKLNLISCGCFIASGGAKIHGALLCVFALPCDSNRARSWLLYTFVLSVTSGRAKVRSVLLCAFALPVASGRAKVRSALLCAFALPVASGRAKVRSALLCAFALPVASGGAKQIWFKIFLPVK